ncbi:MAG: MarR family transcriptional regulator [Anaerolineae bacterium]
MCADVTDERGNRPQAACAQCTPGVTADCDSFAGVAELIDIVAKKLKRLQRQTIEADNLTPTQYTVLNMLWERDGRPLGELASACCCAPSTITGIVDTMEKNHLVSRVPNPDDRRSQLVWLTGKGQALKHATPDLEAMFESCCPGIAPDEVRQLGELLARLNTALDG